MSTKLSISAEALADLLQLSSVDFKIEDIQSSEKFENSFDFILSGNPEYEGKTITLSYVNPEGNTELEEQCINKNFFVNRLHSITKY